MDDATRRRCPGWGENTGRPPAVPEVYACPACQRRFLWRSPSLDSPIPGCPHCAVACLRLGIGGRCPCCKQPTAALELLDDREVTDTRP